MAFKMADTGSEVILTLKTFYPILASETTLMFDIGLIGFLKKIWNATKVEFD